MAAAIGQKYVAVFSPTGRKQLSERVRHATSVALRPWLG